MNHEVLVGLEIVNEVEYQKYRVAMKPILVTYGGGFSYDFKVSDVLHSDTPEPINRVFTIYFESEEKMNSFFSDPKYLEVKEKYFVASVGHTTLIASYHKPTG
ncbi:MAG: DUF1330 domain-containing protein [Kangiellaceae bacterium]|nr:DUF1330 domain-containing protein [Kangiellaceae bacterium]